MTNWGDCFGSSSSNSLVPVNTVNSAATLQCLPDLFSNIRDALLFFAGAAAVFFIIFAGIKMILHGSDAKKIEEDKKALVFAVGGLLLILFSFLILNLIAYFTGTQSCIVNFSVTPCK